MMSHTHTQIKDWGREGGIYKKNKIWRRQPPCLNKKGEYEVGTHSTETQHIITKLEGNIYHQVFYHRLVHRRCGRFDCVHVAPTSFRYYCCKSSFFCFPDGFGGGCAGDTVIFTVGVVCRRGSRGLVWFCVVAWMLACKGNIAHVVVIEKLVDFLDELVQKRATWFEDEKHLCIA
ncbi:serine decarboxylase [Trifolium repens]|nr:serine decarboxylase [Trifolium repens]